MNVILVQRVSTEFAVTNRRLPNEWSDVHIFPKLSDLKAARRAGFVHRRQGLGAHPDNAYRDFSHFTNRGKDVRE